MKIDVDQDLETRWREEQAYLARPLKDQSVPEPQLSKEDQQRLTADCIGPRGGREIYHPSMGRMMGVRGG